MHVIWMFLQVAGAGIPSYVATENTSIKIFISFVKDKIIGVLEPFVLPDFMFISMNIINYFSV
jgi:hypothetical protein